MSTAAQSWLLPIAVLHVCVLAAVSEGVFALPPRRFVNASCANGASSCSAFDVGVSIGQLQKETIAKMFQVRVNYYREIDHNHCDAMQRRRANVRLS